MIRDYFTMVANLWCSLCLAEVYKTWWTHFWARREEVFRINFLRAIVFECASVDLVCEVKNCIHSKFEWWYINCVHSGNLCGRCMPRLLRLNKEDFSAFCLIEVNVPFVKRHGNWINYRAHWHKDSWEIETICSERRCFPVTCAMNKNVCVPFSHWDYAWRGNKFLFGS